MEHRLPDDTSLGISSEYWKTSSCLPPSEIRQDIHCSSGLHHACLLLASWHRSFYPQLMGRHWRWYVEAIILLGYFSAGQSLEYNYIQKGGGDNAVLYLQIIAHYIVTTVVLYPF